MINKELSNDKECYIHVDYHYNASLEDILHDVKEYFGDIPLDEFTITTYVDEELNCSCGYCQPDILGEYILVSKKD